MQRKRTPLASPTSISAGRTARDQAGGFLDVVRDAEHAREVVAPAPGDDSRALRPCWRARRRPVRSSRRRSSRSRVWPRSAAWRASSRPWAMFWVRTSRCSMPPSASAACALARSFLRPPAAGGRVDEEEVRGLLRHRSPIYALARASLGVPADPVGAGARLAHHVLARSRDRSKPRSRTAGRGVERRVARPSWRRRRRCPPGRSTRAISPKKGGTLICAYEVERVVGPGDPGGVRHLERDPAVRVEPDFALRRRRSSPRRSRSRGRSREGTRVPPGARLRPCRCRGRAPARGRASRGGSRRQARSDARSSPRRSARPSRAPSVSKNRRIGYLRSGQSQGARATVPLSARPTSRMRSHASSATRLSQPSVTEESCQRLARIALPRAEALLALIAALFVVLGLTLAACGGDDESSEDRDLVHRGRLGRARASKRRSRRSSTSTRRHDDPPPRT